MYSQLRFGYSVTGSLQPQRERVSSTPEREVGFTVYSQLRLGYTECYRVSSTPEREGLFNPRERGSLQPQRERWVSQCIVS